MSEIKPLVKSKSDKTKKALQSCGKFFIDTKEGTVLGRTKKSLFLLVVYYIIFYALLGGFFVLSLYIFLEMLIKSNEPYLTGEHNLLYSLPGLNAYPRISIESALIIISTNAEDSANTKYINATNTILQRTFGVRKNNGTMCASNRDQPSDIGQFCQYNKNDLGPCMDPLGQMRISKLCLFIRVNKVFGWVPDVINMTASNDILIDCVGQNTGDAVNLREPIYYPSFKDGAKSYGVIANKFFPFIKQEGYVSPILAVQFPEMKNNTAILVQCQTKNLRNANKSVKFEVMVLNKRGKIDR